MISASSAISGLPNSVNERIPRPSGETTLTPQPANGSGGLTHRNRLFSNRNVSRSTRRPTPRAPVAFGQRDGAAARVNARLVVRERVVRVLEKVAIRRVER